MGQDEFDESGEDDFSAPVEMPIEDEIDLHAFAPRDIRLVVQEYLREAARRGFSEVRLIHGKGVGVQRRIVQSELAKDPNVIEFWDAPPVRGGWGATVARLRTQGQGTKDEGLNEEK